MSAIRPEGLGRLVARAEARQQGLRERREDLRRRAASVAERLAAELGASRVALFGSVAHGTFHDRSDVDLAVWGLSAENEGAAAELAARALGAPVDLVRMERAPATLVARVAREGLTLVPRG